jgi:serine/threonine-protein kinase RsbW
MSHDDKLDDLTKSTLKNEFEKACQENSSIAVSFSTRNFPRPIRLGFIKKRVLEVLNLFIPDPLILGDILFALEEAVSNIIEHSYESKADPIIDFQFILYSSKLIVKIDDFGEKGRKFELENSGKYSSLDEMRKFVTKTKGGMGVYLIRKIMDDVKYEARPGEYNRITLTKNFSEPILK